MIDEKLQEHLNGEYKELLVNHEARLNIANNEMGIIRTDIAIIKSKIANISKLQWVIIVAILGAAIAIIFKK